MPVDLIFGRMPEAPSTLPEYTWSKYESPCSQLMTSYDIQNRAKKDVRSITIDVSTGQHLLRAIACGYTYLGPNVDRRRN